MLMINGSPTKTKVELKLFSSAEGGDSDDYNQ
jgi:hypothetical protein